jgi:hypothetical protein
MRFSAHSSSRAIPTCYFGGLPARLLLYAGGRFSRSLLITSEPVPNSSCDNWHEWKTFECTYQGPGSAALRLVRAKHGRDVSGLWRGRAPSRIPSAAAQGPFSLTALASPTPPRFPPSSTLGERLPTCSWYERYGFYGSAQFGARDLRD